MTSRNVKFETYFLGDSGDKIWEPLFSVLKVHFYLRAQWEAKGAILTPLFRLFIQQTFECLARFKYLKMSFFSKISQSGEEGSQCISSVNNASC